MVLQHGDVEGAALYVIGSRQPNFDSSDSPGLPIREDEPEPAISTQVAAEEKTTAFPVQDPFHLERRRGGIRDPASGETPIRGAEYVLPDSPNQSRIVV